MKNILLSNGNQMPIIGLGTWNSPEGEVSKAVEYAITEVGYRHIDCAMIYGNEKEVGIGINKAIKNGIKREEIFVTSKLWNTDHKPENVEKAIKRTLDDLNLTYVDLYLIHWNVAIAHDNYEAKKDDRGLVIRENVSIQDTWRAMESLVDKELVKSIGVANFTAALITELVAISRIKPVMNQIELHPFNSQVKLIEYCKIEGINITSYSPLGTPAVAKSDAPKLLEHELIIELSQKYKKSAAQVLIRWAIERDTIVIPKSTHFERIKENFEVFDFEISDEDMIRISNLNLNYRYVNPLDFWGIPYFE